MRAKKQQDETLENKKCQSNENVLVFTLSLQINNIYKKQK